MKPSDYRLIPAEPAEPRFHSEPDLNLFAMWPYALLLLPAIMVAALFLMGK